MPDPVYSTLDRLHKNVAGYNVGIYVCEQTSTRNPDNTADTGKLTALTDGTWKLLANANTLTKSKDVENDEKEYFDEGGTNARVKLNDAVVTSANYEFSVVNYTPLFDAIISGVANPFSTDYGAGKEVNLYANSSPYVELCLKVVYKNKKGVLCKTEYFYGKLSSTDSIEYNGKIIEPKINVEVQPSTHNVFVNTMEITGQTVVTDDGGGGEGGGVSA